MDLSQVLSCKYMARSNAAQPNSVKVDFFEFSMYNKFTKFNCQRRQP